MTYFPNPSVHLKLFRGLTITNIVTDEELNILESIFATSRKRLFFPSSRLEKSNLLNRMPFRSRP